MNNIPTVQSVIAARLKAARVGRGQRQDDIATEARALGFDWTRATVADLERGARALAPEELLIVVPVVYHLELAELFDGNGQVRYSARGCARRKVLRQVLSGQAAEVNVFDIDAPGPRGLARTLRALPEHLARLQREIRVYMPDQASLTTGELEAIWAAAEGEAERKAAAKLKVPARRLSMAAFGRWGRSLTAERDRRVADAAPEGASPRSLQALRGHVTRTLLAELAEVLGKETESHHG